MAEATYDCFSVSTDYVGKQRHGRQDAETFISIAKSGALVVSEWHLRLHDRRSTDFIPQNSRHTFLIFEFPMISKSISLVEERGLKATQSSQRETRWQKFWTGAKCDDMHIWSYFLGKDYVK